MRTAVPVLACLVLGCSPGPDGTSNRPADTGAGEDAATADTGGNSDTDVDESDGGEREDAAETDSASEDAASLNTNLEITATVDDTTQQFDRAFYGLTSPEASASGDWELHVEVYAGGDPGCPQMDSATPDVTVVMGGIKFPEVPNEQREEDGVTIALLDFTGELYMEPSTEATGEIIYFQDWSLCTDCEGDNPDGYLSFDVDALLEGGSLRGHVYATHCASLNSP